MTERNQKHANLKKQLRDLIHENLEKAVEINDYLSDNPEISGKEYKSSKKIVELLEREGFDVEYPYAGLDTSFKAVYGKDSHARKIAIMVEYDALPEIGHGCGHCTSCATSLLAGISLKNLQDLIGADIHLVGTPIEETDGAKATMVNEGVFDSYDMAIMLHMYDRNLPSPVALALSSNLYTFHGKPSHASSAPWDGVNAFNAVQLMFHAIDMLRQHVTTDVRMHGIIRHPGEAPNIIPEKCSAEIYVRAMESDYLNLVTERIDNCAKGAALATGTTWEKVPTANHYDNLRRNEVGLRAFEEVYKEMGLKLYTEPGHLFGSTDAGNVSRVCPTFHGTIQLVDEGIPTHSKEFAYCTKGVRANKTIEKGGCIIALQILKIFMDDEIYTGMIEDFNRFKAENNG